jgi:hypothetical protein
MNIGRGIGSLRDRNADLLHRHPAALSCSAEPSTASIQLDHIIALPAGLLRHRGDGPHSQHLRLAAVLVGDAMVPHLNRIEVVEAEPRRSPGGKLPLGADDSAKSRVEVVVLISAEKDKLILGCSGSFPGIHEETHTVAGSKPLEIPDLGVPGIPGTLRCERRNRIAGAHGYAEGYAVADTYLEDSGGVAGQLPRVLVLTAARSSL